MLIAITVGAKNRQVENNASRKPRMRQRRPADSAQTTERDSIIYIYRRERQTVYKYRPTRRAARTKLQITATCHVLSHSHSPFSAAMAIGPAHTTHTTPHTSHTRVHTTMFTHYNPIHTFTKNRGVVCLISLYFSIYNMARTHYTI
jgi:hypothetical protein